MNRILVWSITAALAGFLFGFDTVVISGADEKLQTLWNTSDAFHGGVVMGMALWGTVLGAIFGSIPTNKLGRKKTLFLIGVLFTFSALGTAFANDPYIFAFFRFLGGLGIGVSTIAAPTKNRGRLVSMYQFNIVFGILMAFFSNYLISGVSEHDWRWMLGVQAIPSIIYSICVLTIPESPRWLISQSKSQEAKRILKIINPDDNPEVLIQEVHSSDDDSGHDNIFMKKYRFPLVLAFLMAAFNQLSGINAFLYYAPRIFAEAGLGKETALLSSIGIGVVNMIFTLIGVSLIDKVGRKKLMYIGSFGYIISLGLVSAAFYLNWSGFTIPLFLFVFIGAHAIGQGTVIWVFISELFPNHLRASGQAFGSTTHWVLAAIIPSLIPILFSTIGAGSVFLFFTIAMVFQLLFVIFMMPETKGVSLEKLSKTLTK